MFRLALSPVQSLVFAYGKLRGFYTRAVDSSLIILGFGFLYKFSTHSSRLLSTALWQNFNLFFVSCTHFTQPLLIKQVNI